MPTGAQLSSIPAEGPPSPSCLATQACIQGQTGGPVTWRRAAHHSLITAARQPTPRLFLNRPRQRVKSQQFRRGVDGERMPLCVSERRRRRRWVGAGSRRAFGRLPPLNLGNNRCQRWLAPAATGPKVQVCAGGRATHLCSALQKPQAAAQRRHAHARARTRMHACRQAQC